MIGRGDPTIQSRRLRVDLRRLRNERDLTQKDAAQALHWSAAKLMRIENGQVGLSITDLEAMLRLYGIDEEHRIAEFITTAEAAKRKSWTDYRDAVSKGFLEFLQFEGEASVIRDFEPLLMPGLLQTENYARRVIKALDTQDSARKQLDRRLEARMERQKLLHREHPPKLFCIMDEAAVRRLVGGPAVMREQLEYLIEIESLEHVYIQILPFITGEYAGMLVPFVDLEFPAEGDDDLLYLENGADDSANRDDKESTVRYKSMFYQMEDIATPKARFADVAHVLIRDLEKGETSGVLLPN